MNGILKKARKNISKGLTGKTNLTRLKQLIRKRFGKRYALLGHPLSHSASPAIHRRIMKMAGIRGTYRLCDIPQEQLERKIPVLLDQYDGFNITIPYKQKILPYLEQMDEGALRIRAVNTVFKRKGFNTDTQGFRSVGIAFHLKSVLVLGSGGVARVMIFEAAGHHAKKIVISSRNSEQAARLMNEIRKIYPETLFDYVRPEKLSGEFDILLNATPLGMWPHCDSLPVSEEQLRKVSYVYDCIYNPVATRLILKARKLGIEAEDGLDMLIRQALEAQKIWSPQTSFAEVDLDTIRRDLKKQLLKKYPIKIVLTGFMGSGKTTVGNKLAKILGVRFADLDHKIVEERRKTIAAIFKEEGETSFRKTEQRCLKKLLHEPGTLVIATGGGALINPENVVLVHKNCGFIFYLDVPLKISLERIGDRTDRPLLIHRDRSSIINLYKTRLPVYDAIADYLVDGTKTPAQTVRQICKALDMGIHE
jgi:shikimate dehydrogenase